MAAEGVSFEAGYASHPYCSPSRAGLLSGRYQQRFGHENNTPYSQKDPDAGLPLDEVLISDWLKRYGYRTCAIGKWHLGDAEKFWPINRGFDDWFGFFGGGMSYWGDTRDKDAMHGVLKDGVPVPLDELSYLTDDFSDAAVEYIEEYAGQEQPFFMYLAYNAPHGPIQATQEYLDLMSHAEFGDRAAYGAMVAGMDVGIGKVVDKLKETGQYENTLIFFYSDNGGHSMAASSEPFRGHKGMLFEGGIRVPFLISWPQGLTGGIRYEHAISALDIFPTILAAADIAHPEKKLDGLNLLPFLNGERQGAPHDLLFWRYSDGAGYAVRKGKFKMIRSAFKDEFFLFDLENDPYEHHNLRHQYPQQFDELKTDYEQWTKGLIPAKWYDPHLENVKKEEARRQSFLDQASAGEKKKN